MIHDNNELLFLSLNQFVKCKMDEKSRISFIKNHNDCKNGKQTYTHLLKDKLPLSYNDSIHLIYYLHLQQSFLERKGYGFSLITVEDIVIIYDYSNYVNDLDSDLDLDLDSDYDIKFACINSSNIKQIDSKGYIRFITPFSRNSHFYSPEIMELTNIPSKVSHKCFYYSLGILALYCLNDLNGIHDSNGLNKFNKEYVLDTIKGTKLYWLIKRLIDNDISKRKLLMV